MVNPQPWWVRAHEKRGPLEWTFWALLLSALYSPLPLEPPGTERNLTGWRPLMREIPLDPWKRPYRYQVPFSHGSNVPFDVYSLGKDGKPGTKDDFGNWNIDPIKAP